MKLPVPETWETKLSTKGNKASVWQNLLDQKKLPYMAMLRNLRNLIVTGISKKHHQQVVNTISSEKAVIKSKQFPLRFFAAYQAIQELQSLLESDLLKSKRPTTYLVQRKQALPAWKVKLENKIWQRLKNFDESLLKKYKHAIDSAVEIAARRNVNPIQGRTLIICDILSCFDHECAALKGSLINKMHYGCLMLALMISYACEEFDLKAIINDQMWCTPEILDEKILDNVFNLMNNFNITFTKEEAKDAVSTFYNEKFSVLLEHYLCPLTTQGIQFDNIIFLTSGNNFESTLPSSILKDFMKKYRNTVNKNVLHVEVDLTGNQNRFIAERGNGSQLNYVENIDKKYSLKSMPKPRPSIKDESNVDHLTSNLQIQKWKTVRIFISSTFKDMHGERDLIVRFIIPELRVRAKTLNVNIQEVDLRWGITEAESNNSKSLEICLSEVARCEYFLGILGERYGQIAEYNVSNNPEFDWLQEYPLGASLTELEIYCAALADPSAAAERSFFYFRDKMFESQIPEKWKDNFVSENEFNHIKMENLKQRIKESGLEVFNNYPCYWGGVVNDEPVVAGLEEFGQRVLENLWNSLCKYYKKDEISYSDQRLSVLHASYAEAFHQIEGRDSFVKNCVDNILSKSGLFLITGKSGYGKTAVMAELCKVNQLQPVFPYFVGIDSRSFYLHNLLYDLLTSISNHFSIKFQIPNKLENLCSIFHDILEVAVQESTHNRLIIFIDGLDQLMNKNSQDLDWLPVDLPTGVKIILSTATDSFTYKILSERSKYQKNIYKFELAALVMSDREKIVNNDLLPFRKTLDTSPFNNQLLMLISKREAGIPLFLHIACEELKSFGQYENLTSKLRQYPQTLYLLLREILKQLDNIHGKNIVCIALCLISISPEGLDEFELHALISIFNCILNINSSFEEFLTIIRNLKPEDIFVPLKFSALLRTLHGFLRLTEDMKHTLNIKHADFIKAIIDHYNVGKNLLAYHKLLAAYFYNEVKYVCKWDNVSSRCLHLLLYHLNAAEQFNELSSLLCTIEFLKTAIKAGISLEILDYYEMLKSNKLTKNVYLEKLEDFHSFYSQNLHILQRYPGLIYQQALNEQITSSVFKEAAGYTHSNVIRWLTKPKIPTACYLTLSNLKQVCFSFYCFLFYFIKFLLNLNLIKFQHDFK
ncbi:telomerase protein component 1-like [Centruroides sculpturatus]|uniref:telomerase protein component 1-like n=1 Tax=Centruroides sculpturatus TaxID=218467 RepID=UPI000C6D2132|nr:telomerase protein component 1-like [Centruroides sculpturatus]